MKESLQNHDSLDSTLKFFSKAMSFLKICNQRNGLGRNIRNRKLVPGDDDHHKEMIQEFINCTACQFIDDLVTEIEEALSENKPANVAFNVFNINTYLSIAERTEQSCVLNEHYGETKVDNYDNRETQSPSLILEQEQLIEAEMFFSEFDDMKKQAIENLKTEAKRLLTMQKLKQANMEEFLAKN